MRHPKAYKYLASFALPLVVAFSFATHGWLSFATLFYAFIFIPAVEFLIGVNPDNFNELQHEVIRKVPLFDFFLYLTVPIQVACLLWFLFEMKNPENSALDISGKVTAMGIIPIGQV